MIKNYFNSRNENLKNNDLQKKSNKAKAMTKNKNCMKNCGECRVGINTSVKWRENPRSSL